ncbi:MAG: chemotaxis protein CheW [Candidatus Kapaibacterium sp.]
METQDSIIDINAEFQNEDTLADRYLTFRLGNEEYALEIRYVIEILGIQKITEVPNIPKFIKGIINLRGMIHPVIDVRKRFGLKPEEYDERTCIIVIRFDNSASIGLIVDEVSEVVTIRKEQISPPPQTKKGSQSKYISGIGRMEEGVKFILDIDKLLYLNYRSGNVSEKE